MREGWEDGRMGGWGAFLCILLLHVLRPLCFVERLLESNIFIYIAFLRSRGKSSIPDLEIRF